MRLFLSTFTNKIDKKGRVSIPANFRTILAAKNLNEVVAFPSIGDQPCIECCDYPYFEELAAGIDSFGPYTDDHRAFSTSILADSCQLPFDSEGRVMLPAFLIEFAGLEDAATFVGHGKTFEIWNPDRYETFRAEARKVARERRGAFKLPSPGREGGA